MPLQSHDLDSMEDVERAGEAILSSLRHAADLARQKEERAKLKVSGLVQDLELTHQLIEQLKYQAAAAEHRAVEAEDGLQQILEAVECDLLKPLSGDR